MSPDLGSPHGSPDTTTHGHPWTVPHHAYPDKSERFAASPRPYERDMRTKNPRHCLLRWLYPRGSASSPKRFHHRRDAPPPYAPLRAHLCPALTHTACWRLRHPSPEGAGPGERQAQDLCAFQPGRLASSPTLSGRSRVSQLLRSGVAIPPAHPSGGAALAARSRLPGFGVGSNPSGLALRSQLLRSLNLLAASGSLPCLAAGVPWWRRGEHYASSHTLANRPT